MYNGNRRAAQRLGIPPIIFAAMKIKDYFSQTSESTSAEDENPGD